MQPPRRVALVHEWLTSMRGGERVLEALCRLYPEAHLFTLLHKPGAVSSAIEKMPIRTSFLQHLPFSFSAYRYYLPLFPSAIRSLDLRSYDLVISSHHSVAKSVRTGGETLHLCYCHTPMRYIWSMFDEYFAPERAGLLTRTGARMFRGYLQKKDLESVDNPAAYATNSANIRERIRRVYDRDAEVIYPPVEVSSFPLSTVSDDFFLVAGALVPYKRVDLAIEAFNATGRRLIVAGDGPEKKRLAATAGPTIEFRSPVSDGELKSLYARCRALIFPGEEDFGIIPLEAMATGKPVLAFGKGGAVETVVDGKTGVLFGEQRVDSLIDALTRFEGTTFSPEGLREHAMRFDRPIFEQQVREFVDRHWARWREGSGRSLR